MEPTTELIPELPNEIWFHIFSYLKLWQLDIIFQVNHHLYSLADTYPEKRKNKSQKPFNYREFALSICSQHSLVYFKNLFRADNRLNLLKSIIANQNGSILSYFIYIKKLSFRENKKLCRHLGKSGSVELMKIVEAQKVIIDYSFLFFGAVSTNQTHFIDLSLQYDIQQYNKGFEIAAKNGHLNLVKRFIGKLSGDHPGQLVYRAIITAFEKGFLSITQYLVNSSSDLLRISELIDLRYQNKEVRGHIQSRLNLFSQLVIYYMVIQIKNLKDNRLPDYISCLKEFYLKYQVNIDESVINHIVFNLVSKERDNIGDLFILVREKLDSFKVVINY